MDYPVTIRAEGDAGYIATVADLPGCMSDGETPAEAFRERARSRRRLHKRPRPSARSG